MSQFDALQKQMNKERQNAAEYSAFAAALEAENWPGFAHYFEKAAEDETSHFKLFRDYLIDRNETPVLAALAAPMLMDGNQPLTFFQQALKLERENTALILAIEEVAEALDDGQTEDWIIPVVNEQTRSERELVDALLELGRQDMTGLLMLDREYGNK